jgi:hypothetical protein
MNPMLRTVHQILETNLPKKDIDSFLHSTGIKAFQLIKRVTGKYVSTKDDYLVEPHNPYYGYEAYVLSGKKGFVRFTLEPLFETLE